MGQGPVFLQIGAQHHVCAHLCAVCTFLSERAFVCALVCRCRSRFVCGYRNDSDVPEPCVSLNHSFIQQTFLEHLLCVRCCAGAGNTEEDHMELRALMEAPSTPGILGKRGCNSAREPEGSWDLLRGGVSGQGPTQGPSNPQPRLLGKAILFSSPVGFGLLNHRPQDTKQQFLPQRIKNSQGSRLLNKVHKIVKTTPGLVAGTCKAYGKKHSVYVAIWPATPLVYRGDS